MRPDRTSPHPPRLCNIVRSPSFSGYGFNLHTIKNMTGQFIAHVEEGSPAEKALLKQGDRIVEINGVNIESENHTQVVSRITLVPNETNLLVVDDKGDQWYKKHNIIISSELPEVVYCSSVESRHSPTPIALPPLWGLPALPASPTSRASEASAPPHPPRLCNIVRSPSFSGYGFNLHSIKNMTGQFIAHVEEGSPAEKALLKQGDRIVEINGVNITGEDHNQVAIRIKLVPNETNLLVVDDEGDQWYKEHNIFISSELPEVVRGSSVSNGQLLTHPWDHSAPPLSTSFPAATTPHPPRLCHIVRSPPFSSYGFNLHTIKNKTGQYIAKVLEGSPAEKALLKQGDRIVEVNGVNIESETHTEVAIRIKLVPNETNLLVVDDEGDQWYKERNIIISSELPEVVRGSSVAKQPSTNRSEGKHTRSKERRPEVSVSSSSTNEAYNGQSSVSTSSSPPSSVGAPSPTRGDNFPGVGLQRPSNTALPPMWGDPASSQSTASLTSESTAPPHPPRLCNVVRSPTFSGYGFNLHTIKNKTGQYIGHVDEGSPAEKALLKQGDRIVEVNGVNIASENHKQVVSRIKLITNETNLLVVDDEGDAWYKERNIIISSELPEVVRGSSVARRPSTSSSEGKPARSEDRRSVASVSSASNSEASNRQEIQEEVVGAATSAAVVDSDADSVAEVSVEKEINGDSKSAASVSDDDNETDEEKVPAPRVKEIVAVATNGNHEDKTEIAGKSAKSSDSEESEDEDKTTTNNMKNNTTEVVQKIAAKESVAEKPTLKKVEDEDRDSESEKSRSVSVSSASSRGSAGHSRGTNPAVNKSPVSTSPSPPSSVGAPSPTPVYTFPNVGGLNLNMTAAEMREMITAKKKKDIRNTEIDLRKKYEIVQKL